MEKLKHDLWFYLLKIALLGGIIKFIEISTENLGNEIGVSQQTISRNLKILEEEGFLMKRISRFHFRLRLKLTMKGKFELRKIYEYLKSIGAELRN